MVYGNFYGCSEQQHDQRIRTGIRNKYCALVPWLAAAARMALGARWLVVVQGKDVEGHLRASAVGMLRSGGCCTLVGSVE